MQLPIATDMIATTSRFNTDRFTLARQIDVIDALALEQQLDDDVQHS